MEEKKSLNLHQKLVKVREKVVYVQKNAKGYNFKYAAGSAIIAELRQEMDKQNLLLVPTMEDFSILPGTKPIPKFTISYTWIDADNPTDQLTTKFTYLGDGKMSGCQEIGSIQTYAERYFLCKFFQIATDADDVDAFKKKHDLEEDEEDEVVKISNTFQNVPIEEAATKIKEIIKFDNIETIKEYLNYSCKKHNIILSEMVDGVVKNPNKFIEYFKKWVDKKMSA